MVEVVWVHSIHLLIKIRYASFTSHKYFSKMPQHRTLPIFALLVPVVWSYYSGIDILSFNECRLFIAPFQHLRVLPHILLHGFHHFKVGLSVLVGSQEIVFIQQ